MTNKDIDDRIKKLGLVYARHISEMDNDFRELQKVRGGSSFWKSFAKGFKKGIGIATPIVQVGSTLAGQPELGLAMGGLNTLVGNGKKKDKLEELADSMEEFINSYEKKGGCGNCDNKVGNGTNNTRKSKRKQSAKQKARGQLVSKIMKEKGLSLGQASQYIKKHKLFNI